MGWLDDPEVKAQPTAPALTAPAPKGWWENDPVVASPSEPAAPTEAKGFVEHVQAGFQASAPGLAWRGKLPDLVMNPETSKWWERLATGVTQVASELPIMIPAGAAGAAAGAPAGPAGSILAGGAAMFAAPAGIRTSLIEAYKARLATSPADWFNMTREVAQAMLKEGAIGAVTMGTGALARGAAASVLGGSAEVAKAVGLGSATMATRAGSMATGTADVAGQIAAMVTMPAALEGRLPHLQEFGDAAAVILTLKGAHMGLERAGVLRSTADRIAETYAKTGKTPAEQVADAQADPKVAADLTTPTPEVPRETDGRIRMPEIQEALFKDTARLAELEDAARAAPLADPERAELTALRDRVAALEAMDRTTAPAKPEEPTFTPDQATEARTKATERLAELNAKTGPLTDLERTERVFLTNAQPEALARHFKIEPKGFSRQAAEESAQRVHDDVLRQLQDVDQARRDSGLQPLGEEHAAAVAALVRARVRTRAARLGKLPEEIYSERPLQIRDETAAEVAAAEAAIPAGAPTFTPPEVDLFGNPVVEPMVPRLAVENMETREVPLKNLVLSKEVPQFKNAADQQGVVVPLGGKFDRTGVGPIQVWERRDGTLEVISGRHRLDLARRSGEETIPAQIHREAEGFDARQAATLDAQLNIREEQGSTADYAQYFKDSGLSKEAAEERGLLARHKGKTGFAIARDASVDLLAAHRAGLLSDEAALAISGTAPGSERLQALGVAMVNEGKSILVAVNTMKAVDLMAAERMAKGAQGDIFGFDDSAMREASTMAKKASSQQRKISEQIAAVSGASKRPELAKKMGVDVQDPEGIQKRIVELRQEQTLWDNWPMHPELVAKLRGEQPPAVTGREGELNQGPVDEKSPAFKKWFGDSKVVDRDGEPLVVYHGTTHDFSSFNVRGTNAESDFGKGIYTTNNPKDASVNYAGEGQDLTARIERRAESIASEKGWDYDDPRALARARKELHGDAANVMPLYLSIQNPVVLGGDRPTYMEDRQARKFANAIARAVKDDMRVSKIAEAVEDLQMHAYDGEQAGKLIEVARRATAYVEDTRGNLIGSEVIRKALKSAGFDGVIDHTVSDKWGATSNRNTKMVGVDENTAHYIAFEPTQIKSAIGNRGTFNPTDPNILHQDQVPVMQRNENGHPVISARDVGLAKPGFWETRDGRDYIEHVIVDPASGKAAGRVTLAWKGDKVESLVWINTAAVERRKGLAEATVRAILEHNGPEAPLHIGNIVKDARAFWEKLGVEIHKTKEGEDGLLTLDAYRAARPDRAGEESSREAVAGILGERSGATAGDAGETSHLAVEPFELKPETPAELEARNLEAAEQAQRKLSRETPAPRGLSPEEARAQADLFNTQRPLFQSERGSYQIAEKLITTMQGADKSTVVHELGHDWLEEMKADAARPDAPESLKADWQILRRELAIGEDGNIERASHEQFARSIERYVAEGEAPSAELRSVFQRFREWLLEIYQSLMNLNVTVNPELKAVLDRMLATDQEIADARALNVPRAYVAEAKATEARKIVPGFKSEQVAIEPYADELPKGPGEAPDNSHVNYAYINTPLDVKLTMQRMAEIDQANIQKQRGGTDGVKSWAEANAEQAKYVNDILGGNEDTLRILSPRDPDAPGPDVRLGILKKLAVGAAKDSARLRDVVLAAGHDATIRQQLEYMGSIERARMIQAEFLGERASVARALNALKDTTEGSGEIGRMLDAIGYGEEANTLHQAARTVAEEQAALKLKLDEILLNYKGKSVLDIAKLHKQIGTLKGTFKFAKEMEKATTWEMAVEAWRAGLLSGPVTHVTNFFGTGPFMAMRAPVDMLASIIGMARGASPGMGESDRASMSEAVARITGMLGGVADGLKVGKATFDLDDPTGKTEAYRTAIPGRAGELIRVPLRLMGAEDAALQVMYKRGELATLAIRQAFNEGLNPATREFAERVDALKDKPTPEMEAAANQAAARMTFNMPLGEKGVALQLFVNKWNLQWVMPFIRTPINITKEVARMSPFAPLVGEWRADVRQGGIGRDRALAELVLGSGIMALTVAYAFSGQISGGGSPDPGKARGKAGVEQPYSILIGDKWYEYARIQPMGTLVGMAADIANVWDHMNDEEKDKIPKLLARAFANAVTNQTFLQGLTNVVGAMSEPARFGPKFLQKLAGSMVPNVIGQPTAMADPVVREVNSMLDAVQARIPGMRQDLLPKRDWLGEPVETKERVGVVGPVRVLKVSEDKVRLEAARLDISMAAAPKKTHIGKGTGKLGDVELTPEERDTFEKVGGEMAHKILNNIVNADGYDQIPDLIKKRIFAKVLTASHQVAAVSALPMDKRIAYIQSISEKVAAALGPEEQ